MRSPPPPAGEPNPPLRCSTGCGRSRVVPLRQSRSTRSASVTNIRVQAIDKQHHPLAPRKLCPQPRQVGNAQCHQFLIAVRRPSDRALQQTPPPHLAKTHASRVRCGGRRSKSAPTRAITSRPTSHCRTATPPSSSRRNPQVVKWTAGWVPGSAARPAVSAHAV